MKNFKRVLPIFLSICLLVGTLTFTGLFVNAKADASTGILVANTANRVDNGPQPARDDYFNNYYVEGGGATAWLWTTFNDNPAIFKFDLPDTATTFEPLVVGEDYVGTYKIYASKNKTDWYVVAEMTTEYTNGAVYNSTTGLSFGDPTSPKATEGIAFSTVNSANMNTVLDSNSSKTVYLKIGNIVSTTPDQYGSRIQLRYFGITFDYSNTTTSSNTDVATSATTSAPSTITGIFVANTANRADNSPLPARDDYFNKFYVEGGSSTSWLWTTYNGNAAVFKFDLPDASTNFEPLFVGENYIGTYKIYASKNKTDWYVVAEMTTEYTNGAVYNSTSGLSFGDPTSAKTTEGRTFSTMNSANMNTVLTNNSSKIVYLKIGDIVSTAPDQYGSRIQLRYFGITYEASNTTTTNDGNTTTSVSETEATTSTAAPADITYADPYDNNADYNLKTEFRVAVAGNTFDETADGFKTFTEEELADGALQGTITDGNRVLAGAENNTFTFEVDPTAVFIKLDNWDATNIEGIGGSLLFNISIYSPEAEDFQPICDCGQENGGLLPPRFRWNMFDNTWGRSGNNEYVVTNAGINPDTGKKIVKIKLTGKFNKQYDGHLVYKSFLVQTVVPVANENTSSSVTDDTSNATDNSDSSVTNTTSPGTGDSFNGMIMFAVAFCFLILIAFLTNRKTVIKQ